MENFIKILFYITCVLITLKFLGLLDVIEDLIKFLIKGKNMNEMYFRKSIQLIYTLCQACEYLDNLSNAAEDINQLNRYKAKILDLVDLIRSVSVDLEIDYDLYIKRETKKNES